MEVPQNDRIQDAIAHHLATGKYTSAEDVVLAGLQRLDEDEAEHLATVADLQESLADEQAGRLKPLSAVAADVRREHGFSDPT
jgi:Arc/MetJ-type ribon-helix-helix transcriptional regulator